MSSKRITDAWIVQAYDTVTANGDVADKPGLLIEEVVRFAAEGIADGALVEEVEPLEVRLRRKVRAKIAHTRERRRDLLIKEGESIYLAATGEGVLFSDGALLNKRFPIGNGTDKALKNWTPDDWIISAGVRDDNAAVVSQAARKYRKVAESIAALMNAGGYAFVGDLPLYVSPEQGDDDSED